MLQMYSLYGSVIIGLCLLMLRVDTLCSLEGNLFMLIDTILTQLTDCKISVINLFIIGIWATAKTCVIDFLLYISCLRLSLYPLPRPPRVSFPEIDKFSNVTICSIPQCLTDVTVLLCLRGWGKSVCNLSVRSHCYSNGQLAEFSLLPDFSVILLPEILGRSMLYM